MHKPKMTAVVAILALAFTSFGAKALDIRGIHLGDAWDVKTLQAKLRIAKIDPTDPDLRVKCDKTTCSGHIELNSSGATLMEIYVMKGKDQTVSEISLTFRSFMFEKVARALIDKNQNPKEHSTKVVQNGFGAKFEDNVLVWKDSGQTLTAKKYWPDLENSKVALTMDSAYVAEKATL